MKPDLVYSSIDTAYLVLIASGWGLRYILSVQSQTHILSIVSYRKWLFSLLHIFRIKRVWQLELCVNKVKEDVYNEARDSGFWVLDS